MSLATFLYNLTHSHAAQTAVAKIKADPAGATILAAINTAAAKSTSGADKMTEVLAVAQPLVAQVAQKGGASVVAKDVETLARNVIESFLLDAEQALVAAVLKAI